MNKPEWPFNTTETKELNKLSKKSLANAKNMMNIAEKIAKNDIYEWAPINPCINCDSQKTRKSCWRCIDLIIYDREINAQRNLLQYMKRQYNAGFHDISLHEYGIMLRQLDSLIDIDRGMSESKSDKLINRGSFAKYVNTKHKSLCDTGCELYDGRVCDIAPNCKRRQAWIKLRGDN